MSEDDFQDFDQDALEEAYNRALALEKAGDFDAAAEAYRQCLEIDPADHGGAAVRLASMGRGETPPKAPDAYVATLFDQHAEAFEAILVGQLGYDVPNLVRAALEEQGLGPFERMLDLGCGTGLSGEVLRDRVEHITGMDLSERMVEITHEKGFYDALYVGEAVDFVQHADVEPFDLVTATDVLPYMGHLEEFFEGLSELSNPGAIIAFSSETLAEDEFGGKDFRVGAHQRFAHARAYIERLLKANQFALLDLQPITVRTEQGKPVPGHLVLAKKAQA